MTKIKEAAVELLQMLSDEKVVYLIRVMRNMNNPSIIKRSQTREEAWKVLEGMRRKVPDLDYDRELAEYREERYGL